VTSIPERVEIVRRRRAFDLDPAVFVANWDKEQQKLAKRIKAAQKLLPSVDVSDDALYAAAELCAMLAIDGHRGELTLTRAAGALAAYEKRTVATADDVLRVATLALRHRLRKDPLESAGDEVRIERAINDIRAKHKAAA
jgi:magnesium chelatase subunit I